MATLKETFADDLSLFVNIEEFAEMRMINGGSIPVVMDDDALRETKTRFEGADGYYAVEMVFHVLATDYGDLPVPGQAVSVDGRKLLVVDAADEAGLYTITLGAYGS